MPKLPEPLFVEAVKTRFRSLNITLPTVVSTGTPTSPGQLRSLLSQATLARAAGPTPVAGLAGSSALSRLVGGTPAPASSTPPARPTATPQNVPPGLFRAASNDKEDVDFQISANNEFSKYIDAICHTIVGAHDDWRYTAYFKGVSIMAIIATGGSISGPLLSVNINTYGPQVGLWGLAPSYTRAIGDGLASCWREWEQTVRVPALPWYPAFAAWPSAYAPPMPNIPSPLGVMLMSPMPLMPDYIKTSMSRKLGTPGFYSDELFTAIAAAFATVIGAWFQVQMVAKVMGKGSVPTFAPPYVPVGPVIAGSIVEASPHFDT